MGKNKKQFGVWMDSQHATIVGRQWIDEGEFIVLGHVENTDSPRNISEKTTHNKEIGLTQKFFKSIASVMQNVDEIHITGTGQIQEQFMKFLADTPQYKNAVSTESTANKMSDENLLIYISNHFK